MTGEPLVSVITTNWNGKRTVVEWLDYLRKLDYPKGNIDVVVHDNASSDGSPAEILRRFEEMRKDGWRGLTLIEAPEHPGLTGACNAAFRQTAADSAYVLHMDNDVRLASGALRTLVSTLEARPDAGLAGCRVVFYDDPRRLNRGAVFVNWWGGNNKNVDAADVIECDAFLDCVMLVRKALIRELGCYFDERLYFFCLGLDLCMRAKRARSKVLYVPHAVAYHRAGTSTGKHPRLTRYLSIRDGAVFMRHHNTFPHKAGYFLINALFALKQRLLFEDPIPLRALVDGFREIPFDRGWWHHAMQSDGAG